MWSWFFITSFRKTEVQNSFKKLLYSNDLKEAEKVKHKQAMEKKEQMYTERGSFISA